MNIVTEMFRKMGIKLVDFNPKCLECGKTFKEHSDDDLRDCVAGKN